MDRRWDIDEMNDFMKEREKRNELFDKAVEIVSICELLSRPTPLLSRLGEKIHSDDGLLSLKETKIYIIYSFPTGNGMVGIYGVVMD